MGQIKNIKLHIVTDIKTAAQSLLIPLHNTNKQQLANKQTNKHTNKQTTNKKSNKQQTTNKLKQRTNTEEHRKLFQWILINISTSNPLSLPYIPTYNGKRKIRHKFLSVCLCVCQP